MAEQKKKSFTCCICRKKCKGYGNNPDPFRGRNCCNSCDWKFVIPMRTIMMRLQDENEK